MYDEKKDLKKAIFYIWNLERNRHTEKSKQTKIIRSCHESTAHTTDWDRLE